LRLRTPQNNDFGAGTFELSRVFRICWRCDGETRGWGEGEDDENHHKF